MPFEIDKAQIDQQGFPDFPSKSYKGGHIVPIVKHFGIQVHLNYIFYIQVYVLGASSLLEDLLNKAFRICMVHSLVTRMLKRCVHLSLYRHVSISSLLFVLFNDNVRPYLKNVRHRGVQQEMKPYEQVEPV